MNVLRFCRQIIYCQLFWKFTNRHAVGYYGKVNQKKICILRGFDKDPLYGGELRGFVVEFCKNEIVLFLLCRYARNAYNSVFFHNEEIQLSTQKIFLFNETWSFVICRSFPKTTSPEVSTVSLGLQRIKNSYLSEFVFSVGRVIGPLVRFDPGVFQDAGKPVQSRPLLDAPFDAVVAVRRFRTGGRTPDQRDHLHSVASSQARAGHQ